MPKHKVKSRKPARRVVVKPKAKPAAKLPKSPVIRALQKSGVAFELLKHGKAAYTSEEIAKARNRPMGSIVKCLVLTDGVSNIVACIPGDRRVDAPKIREAFGTGKLEFAQEKNLKKLTGMPPGTTSPVGMKTEMPVIVDSALASKNKLSISSGNPKFGIEIKAEDLVKLCKAKVADISK